jgi:hypothetical protein
MYSYYFSNPHYEILFQINKKEIILSTETLSKKGALLSALITLPFFNATGALMLRLIMNTVPIRYSNEKK